MMYTVEGVDVKLTTEHMVWKKQNLVCNNCQGYTVNSMVPPHKCLQVGNGI